MNSIRPFRTFLLVGMLALVCGAARAETADALIAKGDAFDDRLQPNEALKFFLPAEKLEPNNAELLVRIARQYRHLMSETSSKKEKLRLGHISLGFAQRAATLAPKDAEAQLDRKSTRLNSSHESTSRMPSSA